MEIANYDRENFRLTYPHDRTLNVTNGWTQDDMREARNRLEEYLRLKDAWSLISEIDGHSRIQKMRELVLVLMRWKDQFRGKSNLIRRNIKHEIERKISIRFSN